MEGEDEHRTKGLVVILDIQKLQSISNYTIRDNGVAQFINDLNQAGVKFFILGHLPKTYIDGASFFDNGNPVITYTQRYNKIDNFWFTIAHELAHIILYRLNI